MGLLTNLLTVLLIGTVSQPLAFTTGLSLQLNPILTAIIATVGAILGVAVILSFNERIRQWKWLAKKHYCEKDKESNSPVCSTWHRFWMIIGIVIWCVISAFGINLGISGIRALWH